MCAKSRNAPSSRPAIWNLLRELGSFSDSHRPEPSAASTSAVRRPAIDVSRLQSYLQRWSALDGSLVSRLGDRSVSCSEWEKAQVLLRAYAPLTWQRMSSCTADELAVSQLGMVLAVPLDQLAGDEPLLLGVTAAGSA
jgi:hypothetical protein